MAVPEGFQRQGRKLFFTLLPLLMASMPDAVKVILGGPLDTAELLKRMLQQQQVPLLLLQHSFPLLFLEDLTFSFHRDVDGMFAGPTSLRYPVLENPIHWFLWWFF